MAPNPLRVLTAGLALLPSLLVFQCSLEGLSESAPAPFVTEGGTGREGGDAQSQSPERDGAHYGRVAPALIVGLEAPEELAKDNDFLYFTTAKNGGAVERCPITGCDGPPEVLASRQSAPRSLVVQHSLIAWVNAAAGEIMLGKVGPGNPDMHLHAVARDQAWPAGVAPWDPQTAIWSNSRASSGTAVIARGSSASAPIALSRVALDPGPLIVPDSEDVVWGEADGIAETPLQGDGHDGERSCLFVLSEGRQHGIAADVEDPSILYWTTSQGEIRSVRRPRAAEAVADCAKHRASFTELASGQGNAWAIAADAKHVYFTVNMSGNRGSLRRVPVAGGAVEVLCSELDSPRGLVLDDEYAYVSARGTGMIHRVPKEK